ncbi:isopenicillin-N epimerase [Luteitalea sp. TBR-22]|uniref:aminotransferase class V-fold PLP-dependent enzyme n=1 Tax=Luteitalea sp. TBR-22 TaxID=2802971 RepID=UPI001AF049AA|nr:aminotransferase class V-fold PLP-dependent enzyme [Luteitalea sp. TBR-22]BCS34078.1 isopenicillin-N epimerase [Luteitalea sp. TBR-22]
MPAFGRAFLSEFPLDPSITYLNHGTVGVTPSRVLAAQQAIRDEIERQPSRFLLRELHAPATSVGCPREETPRLRVAAGQVGAFLGAQADDLVFVDNITTGANAVLRSFPFEPGDELLITDLGYGGIAAVARFATREKGAHVTTATMPWPFTPEGIADAIVEAAGPRTRLAVVDHIAADSALVLPVADIVARLHDKGVAVMVDGAHAPGAIAVDIAAIGADWYVANLHKWMWVPRSSGILWAAPERQASLHPAVISWGLDLGFTTTFDLPGTRDPSAHLAAPAAIALFEELGTEAVRAYNHDLAWQAAHHVSERWGTAFTTPESMIGTMATVTLPASLGTTRDDALRLRDALLLEDGIEIPVHAYRGQLRARISAQVYNDMDDMERLADAILKRAAVR